jgi:hypothetical protein
MGYIYIVKFYLWEKKRLGLSFFLLKCFIFNFFGKILYTNLHVNQNIQKIGPGLHLPNFNNKFNTKTIKNNIVTYK